MAVVSQLSYFATGSVLFALILGTVGYSYLQSERLAEFQRSERREHARYLFGGGILVTYLSFEFLFALTLFDLSLFGLSPSFLFDLGVAGLLVAAFPIAIGLTLVLSASRGILAE
jgi:hypothetical protein